MSRHEASLPSDYFEGMFAGGDDPWGFATSPYERAKYEATLASLPRPRYRNGLELGCSIGVLTRQLAGRCDALLGLDIAASAIAIAEERCRDLPNVRFARAVAPHDWPEGSFDLVVLSEVIYFLDRTDMMALAKRVESCLDPAGDVVLVHWLGETDYPLSGDEAADGFIAALAAIAAPIRQDRNAEYRLDILRRSGPA